MSRNSSINSNMSTGRAESNGRAKPLLATTSESYSAVDDRDEVPNVDRPTSAVSTTKKDISLPAWLCCGHSIAMNHNVFLTLAICAVYGVSESLWNGTANAAYLKKLGHNRNGPLGNIEAVSGLSSLLTALPVGYLADKAGRSYIIAFGGWLVLAATVFHIVLLMWIGTEEIEDEDNDFLGISAASPENRTLPLWLYGVVMAMWGVCDGVFNGPVQALYADSTATGERSVYYTYLFASYIGATSVGPIVSIFLFQSLGDTWGLYELRVILYVGLGIGLLTVPLMLMLDDKKALDETAEADANPATANATNVDADGGASTQTSRESADGRACASEATSATVDEDADADNADVPRSETTSALRKWQRWIPYIIFAQSLVMAIGSGMTVKFFPLFFKDEVGMSPSHVQIIYACVPFIMIIASGACSEAAKYIGRVQATLAFTTSGIGCLFSMVFFKSYLDTHPFVLVPVFIIHTSLVNSAYPLQESILMDFVAKEERARWKSLESVATFGWCGSAAYGGWLADKYDYTYTFLITAIVQSTGILIFSTLLPLVPRKEGSRDHEDTDAVAVNNDDNDDGDGVLDVTNPESLSEPLLNETSVE
uniref:Major facilitator superfamily (MFS) profile domain-containing protein n=1 Tax=Craspedostauros australis TaxID=1486917 RepID=A0A7R9WYF0_9STRA|mmetsp:Transcript_4830/g.12653  ORF Transcript_4830/g.12653 Transcript_4830/m.12653 type:complete len:597 (+) Transcript_4830:141-1931(+)